MRLLTAFTLFDSHELKWKPRGRSEKFCLGGHELSHMFNEINNLKNLGKLPLKKKKKKKREK